MGFGIAARYHDADAPLRTVAWRRDALQVERPIAGS
jgi:hypothetical protein